MKTAVLTGSFDPVTKGHIYLLEQALQLFDKVYIAMLINPDKTYTYSESERLCMLNDAIKGIDNAIAKSYNGYAVDFCKEVGAKIMVRGVRNADDLAYELKLRKQNLDFGDINTLFLLSDELHKSISSTEIKKNLNKSNAKDCF